MVRLPSTRRNPRALAAPLGLLIAASLALTPLPAHAVSGDLIVNVQEYSDLPGNESVLDEAGDGSYIRYYVAIESTSGEIVSGASMKIEGPDQAHFLTPGCTWVSAGSYSLCPLEPLAASDITRLTFLATPWVGVDQSQNSIFTVIPPNDLTENVTANDSDTITHWIREDTLSLRMTSYPMGAPSAGTLDFEGVVKNASNTAVSGAKLQVRFSACFPSSDQSLSEGCSQGPVDPGYLDYLAGQPIVSPAVCTTPILEDPSSELYEWPRPYLSNCTLADLPSGETVLPIRFEGPICALLPGDICVLDVSFRVLTPVGASAGFMENDSDLLPAYVVPKDSGQDAAAQVAKDPLEQPLTTSTGDANGLSATDPTAVDLTLPATYTGTASMSELDEAALGGGGIGSVSLFGFFGQMATGPQPRDCATDRLYPMDCQVFLLDLTTPVTRPDIAYRLEFKFHSSNFRNDVTGKLLKIGAAYLFHDGLLVSSCPKGTKESNFFAKVPSGDPCLLKKSIQRGTGYYVFVVLTGVNGAWKAGR